MINIILTLILWSSVRYYACEKTFEKLFEAGLATSSLAYRSFWISFRRWRIEVSCLVKLSFLYITKFKFSNRVFFNGIHDKSQNERKSWNVTRRGSVTVIRTFLHLPSINSIKICKGFEWLSEMLKGINKTYLLTPDAPRNRKPQKSKKMPFTWQEKTNMKIVKVKEKKLWRGFLYTKGLKRGRSKDREMKREREKRKRGKFDRH